MVTIWEISKLVIKCNDPYARTADTDVVKAKLGLNKNLLDTELSETEDLRDAISAEMSASLYTEYDNILKF